MFDVKMASPNVQQAIAQYLVGKHNPQMGIPDSAAKQTLRHQLQANGLSNAEIEEVMQYADTQ